ncbi:lipase family protein [Gordonia rhizosphera]|uniref:Putative lipase n=1 Tax=Gordonia rhizosphera NBRC 16068 TaxID=1108045 RepID=K6VPX3_9ACTN|nr:lipase family protein [Gordonia rhizosphera]GAB88955.1 putative lipase [Gordonia rhizosphera NBRC 16068]
MSVGKAFRRWSLGALITSVAAATVAVTAAGPAIAEPVNLLPAPTQLPNRVDSLVPPPAVPKLAAIPARSVTPGASRELQELREAIMPTPVGDSFFDDWPRGLTARQPGDVLTSRTVTKVAAPLLFGAPVGSVRQIKFRTVDAENRPIFGTATLFVPPTPWKGPGARPIMINNPPIVTLGTRCTTGYTMSHGYGDDTNSSDVFPPTTGQSLAKGYAVIMPDHTGPRMAYAEPYIAAHVVLDSARAAAKFDPRNFGKGPIAMLGYSGGAIATNATAKLASSYAPDVASRFVGAAIGGVPADYRVLARAMNANLGTGIFHAAILGITRERPELLPLANNLARWLATNETLKNICTGTMGNLGATFVPTQLLSNDPDPFHSPVAERIFDITEMKGHKAAMPIYIYHGTQEWWIPASQARSLFAEQCRLGANATYREYPGEHITTLFVGFPDAMNWLEQRLAGHPPKSQC